MDHFAYGVILDQNGFADDTKFIFTKNAVVGKNKSTSHDETLFAPKPLDHVKVYFGRLTKFIIYVRSDVGPYQSLFHN